MERYKSPKFVQRGLALALWLGGTATLWANSPADALYAVAAAHYGQGAWESAEEAFGQFLKLHSRDPRAASAEYFRGECLVQSERYPEALDRFEQFLTRHPRHPQANRAQFRAGEIAFRLGEREKAERYLATFRRENAGHELEAFAVPHLASLALEEGDVERAAELYSFALRTFPRGPLAAECRLGVATAQERLGNLAEAERFYRVAALSRDQLIANQARLQLAMLSCKQDDHATTLELLEPLAQSDEEPGLACRVALWRGRALAGLDRRLDAAQVWWEAVEKWPEQELAESLAFQSAQLFRRLDHRDEAEQAYRWLTDHRPASHWVEESLAALVSLRLQEARAEPMAQRPSNRRVSETETGLEADTADTGTETGAETGAETKTGAGARADGCAEAEREAIAFWHQLASRFPESRHRDAVLQRLGHHLLRQEKYELMLAVLADSGSRAGHKELGLAGGPNNSRLDATANGMARAHTVPVRTAPRPSHIVSYLYALTYWGLEDHESAWQQLVRLVDDDLPSSLRPGVARLRAACLLALRRFDEAIPMLKSDIQQQPDGPSARPRQLQLALALTEVGRLDEAARVLESLGDESVGPSAERSEQREQRVPPAAGDGSLPLNPGREIFGDHENDGDLNQGESATAAEPGTTSSLAHPLDAWSHPPSSVPFSQVALHLAERAFTAENYALASRQFQRVAENAPGIGVEFQARLGWGWSEFRMNRPAAAGTALDPLLAKGPGTDITSPAPRFNKEREGPEPSDAEQDLSVMWAEAACLRARIHERLEQPEEAVRLYRRVAATEPSSRFAADSLFAAGRLEDKRGRRAEANELLGRLLDDFPEYHRADVARYLRGWTLVELEEEEAADAVFQQLVDVHTTSQYWPDAVYRLAERAARAESLERAEDLIDQLLKKAPTSHVAAQGLYLRGQLAAEDRRWADLEVNMQRLLRDYPRSPHRLQGEYWMAEASYQQGRYTVAARRFEKLSAATESRQETWVAMIPLRLAQSLAHLGQWDAARRTATTLEARFPGFSQQHEADYVIGRALVHEAKLAQAREAFHRVTASPTGRGSETAAMAQWMIGETYFHQRKFREARDAYLTVETLYNYPRWRAAARLQLGKCHEAQQKWEAAIRYYKLVIDSREEPQLVSEAESHLSRLERREANQGSARRLPTPR